MQKIMFNDKFGLTQAVLEGRKTMTRRIVTEHILEYCRNRYNDENASPYRGVCWPDIETAIKYIAKYHGSYKVGEVVAIAQSYNDIYEELKRTHGSSSIITRKFFHNYIQGGRMPVSNKMFVKADLMPHQIRITDIKAERLQDIDCEDCFMEGVMSGWRDCGGKYHGDYFYFDGSKKEYYSLYEAFAALINAVSGKGTWEKNPWCFCYQFELVK